MHSYEAVWWRMLWSTRTSIYRPACPEGSVGAAGGELRDAVEPARIELEALVVLEKILARDAATLGEPHQAPLVAHQALVDVVELLDQRVETLLFFAPAGQFQET
jgi:hypothetical protein